MKVQIDSEKLNSLIAESIVRVLNEKKVLVLPGQGGGNAAPAPAPAPADPGMGMDPNAMGGAPVDPSMGGAPAGPDAMGGDPGTESGGPMMGNEGGDDIQTIFNNLNDEHQSAVKKYAQAMEDQETEMGAPGGMDSVPPADPSMGGMPAEPDPNTMPPMQESFIFTKRQLRECFGEVPQNNPNEKPLVNKKELGFRQKSPFSAKRFGKTGKI